MAGAVLGPGRAELPHPRPGLQRRHDPAVPARRGRRDRRRGARLPRRRGGRRSPKFDGGIATRLDNIPFGVVVNRDGRRFYDEGEELWPKRYAIWGTNIATQPGQIAYGLWDSKVSGLFLPPMYRPY